MTLSGTPSWASSIAWAWRSWCGAKRRRTPARAASRRSMARAGAGCHGAPARGAVDHAEQGADGHGPADGQPAFELLKAPVVHANLATAAAFAAPDQYGPAAAVEIELVEVQGLLDAQSGAPEDNDQRACPGAVDGVFAAAHDGDDFLRARWIGREVAALLGRRASRVAVGYGGRRAASSERVQRRRGRHECLLQTSDEAT